MAHPLGYLILLGRPQILLDLGTVVDDDARLQPSCQRDQFLCFPVLCALALLPLAVLGQFVHDLLVQRILSGIREVEPQDVDLAVVGQKFRHLIAHVLGILVHVTALAELLCILVVAARMMPVNREFRMVPVDQRIIEADLQALGAEGIHVFLHKVAAGGRVGALVIGIGAVKHAEAFVVLGGEHRIFHAGCLGLARPFAGVVQIGIKVLEVLVVMFLGNAFAHLDPLVARRHGVQAPVDEHAESVVAEPCGIAGSFSNDVAAHMPLPFEK